MAWFCPKHAASAPPRWLGCLALASSAAFHALACLCLTALGPALRAGAPPAGVLEVSLQGAPGSGIPFRPASPSLHIATLPRLRADSAGSRDAPRTPVPAAVKPPQAVPPLTTNVQDSGGESPAIHDRTAADGTATDVPTAVAPVRRLSWAAPPSPTEWRSSAPGGLVALAAAQQALLTQQRAAAADQLSRELDAAFAELRPALSATLRCAIDGPQQFHCSPDPDPSLGPALRRFASAASTLHGMGVVGTQLVFRDGAQGIRVDWVPQAAEGVQSLIQQEGTQRAGGRSVAREFQGVVP